VTIAAGVVGGLDRETAARFSFLLATPIVAGAGLLKLLDVAQGESDVSAGPLIAGIVSAAIFGLLAIRVLLAYLQVRSLAVFAWYRFGLAAVVLIVAAIR
jgi:undecaprenyl-diphosphatase